MAQGWILEGHHI